MCVASSLATFVLLVSISTIQKVLALPPGIQLDSEAHDQAFFSSTRLPSGYYEPAPLPVANSTKSFWTHSAPDASPLASEGSTGELTTDSDVCIIGSGITGVSAAYHIAKTLEGGVGEIEPLSVVVLDARDFCSGATGRNGGHFAEGAFSDFRARAESFGTDNAIRSVLIESYVTSAIASLLHSEGLADAVDLVEEGRVSLQFKNRAVQKSKLDYEAAIAAGVEMPEIVRFIDAEEMEELYGTRHPGVRLPGRNLWPLKLVTQLYNHAKRALPSHSTLTLHTRTPVTCVSPIVTTESSEKSSQGRDRRWLLTTPRGNISCTSVLHATNGYASHLLPQFAGPDGILPTRGQVIALRANATLEAIGKTGWVGNEGFEYWFPRPLNGTSPLDRAEEGSGEEEFPLIILGGGRENEDERFEFGRADDSWVNPKVGQSLREFLPEVFTGMYAEGREPEMEWTGIMAYTKMGDPFVGPVITPSPVATTSTPPGQYISAGYSGHGMPRGYACAEVATGMMLAEIFDTTYELPKWFPTNYLTENRV